MQDELKNFIKTMESAVVANVYNLVRYTNANELNYAHGALGAYSVALNAMKNILEKNEKSLEADKKQDAA